MPRSGYPRQDNATDARQHHTNDKPDALSDRDRDALLDESEDDGRDFDNMMAGDEAETPLAQRPFQEEVGEQADFREQFDEDLYNDREEAPVQGNTADVAMGDHRFGSDAEAYAEYAHRRPGEDSSVGQSRDLSDISNEDDSTP